MSTLGHVKVIEYRTTYERHGPCIESALEDWGSTSLLYHNNSGTDSRTQKNPLM